MRNTISGRIIKAAEHALDTRAAEALISQARKNAEAAKAQGGNRVVATNMPKKYPIAETFVSPQGEGLYTGCLMLFVRLGGCSVGKKLSPTEKDLLMEKQPAFYSAPLRNDLGQVSGIASTNQLQVYTEKCTTWDGREFLCDTDFRTREVLTAEEILARVPDGVKRICLTGGEPLNHDLTAILDDAYARSLDVHIETSGTVPMYRAYPKFTRTDLIGESVHGWIWLTVSPKLGVLDYMLDTASELKFLVDEYFDPDKIPEIARHRELVYIQPINGENTIDPDNMQRCLILQKEHPHWRLSSQSHKAWGVR